MFMRLRGQRAGCVGAGGVVVMVAVLVHGGRYWVMDVVVVVGVLGHGCGCSGGCSGSWFGL